MDGFEDNRGIVVLGATNRPGAIDSALIRPGRFDRIIYMPLPDTEGRAKILQVGGGGEILWARGGGARPRGSGAGCWVNVGRTAPSPRRCCATRPPVPAPAPRTTPQTHTRTHIPTPIPTHTPAALPQVHARNKAVDPTINWKEVARAMAGFTGAGARP